MLLGYYNAALSDLPLLERPVVHASAVLASGPCFSAIKMWRALRFKILINAPEQLDSIVDMELHPLCCDCDRIRMVDFFAVLSEYGAKY